MSVPTPIVNNNDHLLSTYQILGSILIILYALLFLIPTINFEVGIFIIPILQMRGLRPRTTSHLSKFTQLVSA